jgi:multisubunit Na+/H+ antiporter MnhC subunit
MLAPIAIVLIVAGVLPLVMSSSIAIKVLAAVMLSIGVLLAMVAAGLRRSAQIDDADAEMAAIINAAGCGDSCSSCGVGDCAVKTLPRL